MILEELLGRENAITMGDGTLYRMVINEELTVHARSFVDDDFFYLYANVGLLPESEKLKAFMEESLFNHGLYFSCHQQSNKLILMTALDSRTMTFEQYKKRLQAFVDVLSHWETKRKTERPAYEKEDMLKLLSQKKRVFFI